MNAAEIADLRKKLGLNMQEFAKKVGVSRMTIFRWETERTSPLPVYEKTLERLAKRAAQPSQS